MLLVTVISLVVVVHRVDLSSITQPVRMSAEEWFDSGVACLVRTSGTIGVPQQSKHATHKRTGPEPATPHMQNLHLRCEHHAARDGTLGSFAARMATTHHMHGEQQCRCQLAH